MIVFTTCLLMIISSVGGGSTGVFCSIPIKDQSLIIGSFDNYGIKLYTFVDDEFRYTAKSWASGNTNDPRAVAWGHFSFLIFYYSLFL